MEIYVVGGAIRDTLLNRPVKDIDYVVVGSSPEEMIAKGFHRVGADFPVFLDATGEEYALARTERKTAAGYNGFETTFDSTITLKDDLNRRDLTINSMAVRLEDWEEFQQTRHSSLVIDPHNGIGDLVNGELRHTSEAFSEDPVRVLRTARFAARYGFSVELPTHNLMSKIVHELNSVPQERIWAEVEKGLMEEYPGKMIDILQGVGAFNEEAMRPYRNATIPNLDRMRCIPSLSVRFAVIATGFTDKDYETCRIPSDCVRLSKAVNQFRSHLHAWHVLDARTKVDVLNQLRVTNDEQFILRVGTAVELLSPRLDAAIDTFAKDLKAFRSIDAAIIAAQCSTGKEIKNKLFEARVKQMTEDDR